MNQIPEKERRLLSTDWPIVALFGQSGTGRSTFINLVAKEQQNTGLGIESCTDRVTLVEAKIKGKSVVVVDTPGIDDTRPGMTESDVLATIAQCLEATGRKKRWVTGILYLHRITDPRFTPTAQRISAMLKKLCGDNAMNRVMFCTTMWDMPSLDESKLRHDQLCNNPVLGGMIRSGARTATHSSRWNNAQTNAESILSDLIEGLRPGPLVIQDQMIGQDKTVAETDAGQVLIRHLGEERVKTEREIEELRAQMNAESGANRDQLAKSLAAQQRMMVELKRQEQQLTKRDRECCIIS